MVFRHHSKYKSGDGDGGPIWGGVLLLGGFKERAIEGSFYGLMV